MLDELFDNNRIWAQQIREQDPEFFTHLAANQSPEYLWIGCSDSRVPANQIVGMGPGELFVHRNIGNVVIQTDLNCLSVIQFAVDVLKVGHIIVCGHYSCGGIRAAMSRDRHGLIDNWLRHIQNVETKHKTILAPLTEEQRFKTLCELNVVEQVHNVCETTVVEDAWQRGQSLHIHGWLYDLHDGLLREPVLRVLRAEDLPMAYDEAITAIAQRVSS